MASRACKVRYETRARDKFRSASASTATAAARASEPGARDSGLFRAETRVARDKKRRWQDETRVPRARRPLSCPGNGGATLTIGHVAVSHRLVLPLCLHHASRLLSVRLCGAFSLCQGALHTKKLSNQVATKTGAVRFMNFHLRYTLRSGRVLG